MKPEQRELFRLAILRILDANRTRFGLGVPAIGHLMAQFGFPSPSSQVVAEEVDYLAGKRLVEEVLKEVSRENRAWRITTEGIAFVDQRT